MHLSWSCERGDNMTGFILSAAVELAAIAALIFTIKYRKKVELPIFLALIAFEVIVILAAGWTFLIYGTMIEMGNM